VFIANFRLKTRIQWLLFTLQDFVDFPRLHPAREMKIMALRETIRYAKAHMPFAVGVESAREVLNLALKDVSATGHYLEFGVYKGGTTRHLAKSVPPSQIINGFDSFEGLRESWSGSPTRFNAGGRLPQVPQNVTLHKGYFEDSLPSWVEKNPGNVSFLHIDCDLYSSTKTIFECLKDRIVPGTVIVFDEYFNYPNWKAHEFRAFQEFVATFHVRYDYLAYARFQVAVKIREIGITPARSAESSALEALHGGVANLKY